MSSGAGDGGSGRDQGSAPLRERVLSFLAEHHVVSLATAAGGEVWAASVFYASDDLDLVFVSSPQSRHGQHIAASDRVAGTIDTQQVDWREIRGVQLEGEVAPARGADLDRALEVYLRRFPWVADFLAPGDDDPAAAGAVPMAVDGREVAVDLYRLRPSRVLLIDNRLGFGHREELALTP